MKRETRTLLMILAAVVVLGAMLPSASSAPTGPKTKRLTRDELEALARDVGFPDPSHAATIALRESGGDPRAVNDTRGRTDLPKGTTNEHSCGLWQINILAHRKYTCDELLDPKRNAEAAFEISKRGTDWSPWSTAKAKAPTVPSAMPPTVPSVPRPTRTMPKVGPPAVPGEPPSVEAQKGIEAAATAAERAMKGED